MTKQLTQEEVDAIREEAISWLMDKRHSFSLLDNRKNEIGSQWNNPDNATARVMHSGALTEINRLRKLNLTDLIKEFEYTHLNSIYVNEAVSKYSKESDKAEKELSLKMQKLALMTKGRPKGSINKVSLYLRSLIKLNPKKTSKELYKIAVHEAQFDLQDTPFEYDSSDGGTLFYKEEPITPPNFSKRISKLKNRQKP